MTTKDYFIRARRRLLDRAPGVRRTLVDIGRKTLRRVLKRPHQRMALPVEDKKNIFTQQDILLKDIEFSPGVRGFLALPFMSTDPIVKSYIAGEQPNNYMLQLLEILTQPGDQVLDLGGHIGSFCVPASLMGRHVLTVEAAPTQARLIEASRRANALNSLSIVCCAITPRDGPVPFNNNGLYGAIDFTGMDTRAISVAGKRLSVILQDHDIQDIALIKMDIEGSELVALQSIVDLLARANDPAILYESNEETFRRAGYCVADMRGWLEAHGYRSFRIENDRWVYAPPHQPQPELWVDLLALKPRHETQFSAIIDEAWDSNAMRGRFYDWAAMPHDNVRAHLRMLLSDPDIQALHPDLPGLAVKLRPV